MTTDVAEATQAQPLAETAAAPAPVEEVVPSAPEGAAPEAALTDEGASPTGGFDVTSLPEYREGIETPDPAVLKEAAAPEMPGEPVEQVVSRAEAQRAAFQRQFMQASDDQIQTYFKELLGLSPQDSYNLWHGKLGPAFRALLQNNAVYNKDVFHEAVNQLPKEAQERFYAQSYRGQPEAVKGIYTAGVAEERARWEAKLKSGELRPAAAVKKIAEAAYTRGLGLEEQAGETQGSSSGQVTGGAVAPGRSFQNEGALSRAFNSNQITREQYSREFKRLTGHLPGE